MNMYVNTLRLLREQEAHLPKEIGDQWRTPDWLFSALNKLYGPLVVDLFTDGQNSKCPTYFTAEDNALVQDWGAALKRATDGEDVKCFANPPYSTKKKDKREYLTGMTHIMAKAYDEHLKGVSSVWLVKSATSESWWPDGIASQIIHIKGRIGFEPPLWYKPDEMAGQISGAGFGASIVIFNGQNSYQNRERYITREYLMEIGAPLANMSAETRQLWINRWDEI